MAREPTSLRLLLVTPRYHPFVGGIETHVAEVARRLVACGDQVTVLTADPGGRLPPFEDVAGVAIRRVRAWPAGRDYYFAPGIYHMISRGHWDVMHCQGYHTFVAPMAMSAARRARMPYVLTFHSGGHSSRLRNMVRGIQRWALRPLLAQAVRLIGVSHYEAELFRASLHLPPQRFTVIPNGAYLPSMDTTAVPDCNLILSVGRLERYKGHQRVIAAMPYILAARPDARLLVVGSGPFASELRQLIARLGLSNQVALASIGSGNREEMAQLMSRAAVVTLLSDYEAHPLAVMEALALGRPVVATYTSGLAELADRGLVCSVPLKSSSKEIASALLQSLTKPAPPRDVQLPTWEDCTTALRQLYVTVARGPSCIS